MCHPGVKGRHGDGPVPCSWLPLARAGGQDRKVGRRLIGVYDADGRPRGELAYLLGRVRGTAHCALCDITHGRLRRRPDFDQACRSLPIELDLRHRDELDPPVSAALAGRLPCVASITDDGEVEVVLSAEDLDACGGRPDEFVERLLAALASGA